MVKVFDREAAIVRHGPGWLNETVALAGADRGHSHRPCESLPRFRTPAPSRPTLWSSCTRSRPSREGSDGCTRPGPRRASVARRQRPPDRTGAAGEVAPTDWAPRHGACGRGGWRFRRRSPVPAPFVRGLSRRGWGLSHRRTRDHQHATVVQRGVVEIDAQRKHIVIGVRVKCKILMPLHGTAAHLLPSCLACCRVCRLEPATDSHSALKER
jgi:hypothetical protein